MTPHKRHFPIPGCRVLKIASWRLCALALKILLLSTAAQAVDVHQFEQNLTNQIGQPVELEGRFRSAGAGKLYLVGSAIEFHLGKYAGQVRRSMQSIAVEGQLISGLPKPVFRVESFRALPPDVERFAQRRNRITPGNERSLFTLAAWGRQQAHWYHDRPLEKLSAEAYRQAFDWAAQRAVQLRDTKTLLLYAYLGEAIGMSPSSAELLRHDVALDLSARAKDAHAKLAAASQVRKLLSGTETPLQVERLAWADQYLLDPQAVFAGLAPSARREAARTLWANLTAQALQLQAAKVEGAELDELIQRASTEIPDRPKAIRQLRLRAARARVAAAARLSRAEMLRLRDELAELDEAAASRAVVERWLQVQRQGLPSNDAEGRLLLAHEYRDLLDDPQTSANLLIESLRLAPDLTEASNSLAELGYTQRGGVWLPPAAMPTDAQPMDEPGAELAAGASEATVISRLRRPDRIARVATQNSISEHWIYEGPPRLNIYLRRSTATGQAYVTRIEGAAP